MTTPSNVVTRLAASTDAPVITGFNIALCRETEHKELDADTVLKGVKRFLSESKRGVYFIAEFEGQIVGQTAITYEWSDWRDGEFWWIQSVYVRKEHRGSGVFRTLYHHIQDLAKADAHCCGIRLYMERDNATARKAYGKLGFEETGYEVFETKL